MKKESAQQTNPDARRTSHPFSQVMGAAARYNGVAVVGERPYKAGLTLAVRHSAADSPSETLVEFDSFENATRFAEYAEQCADAQTLTCTFAEPEYDWSL